MNEVRIAPGGLMRCCLEALQEEIARRGTDSSAYTEGEILHCKYCKEEMIYDLGVWRWNREQ